MACSPRQKYDPNTSSVTVTNKLQIVDFVIWLLFSKKGGSERVQHLLCQGYRKDGTHSMRRDENATTAIPGLISMYLNSHADSMKAEPWPTVLTLMGKEGEKTMINLILDCGIFKSVEGGKGNYYQLSGVPHSYGIQIAF